MFSHSSDVFVRYMVSKRKVVRTEEDIPKLSQNCTISREGPKCGPCRTWRCLSSPINDKRIVNYCEIIRFSEVETQRC